MCQEPSGLDRESIQHRMNPYRVSFILWVPSLSPVGLSLKLHVCVPDLHKLQERTDARERLTTRGTETTDVLEKSRTKLHLRARECTALSHGCHSKVSIGRGYK